MKKFMCWPLIWIFVLLSGCSQKQADLQPHVEVREVNPMEDFYGIGDEPTIIYAQVPFGEDRRLVLADKVTDGEHYPNLYLLGPGGRLVALTRHSDCWTLNFTEFGGYRIFFGLAGRETYQSGGSSRPVKKVEAVFADKSESTDTRENILAQINLKEGDPRVLQNAQAYILPVKGRDMPEDVFGIFADGEKLSLSQVSVDRNQEYIPGYFMVKKRSIYSSCGFTYSPMLSPESWERVDSEGETGLRGKTDENGNVNALFLRPSPSILKAIHFQELPYDVKSFCLSNSYPWITAFSPGEEVEAVYSGEVKLYDCRAFKLTPRSVDREMEFKDFQPLRAAGKTKLKLPGEQGHYLILLRTEKYGELRSHLGVLRIKA